MWISLLGLILWLVLGRIRGLLKDVGPLEDQLRLAEEARDKAEAEVKQKAQVRGFACFVYADVYGWAVGGVGRTTSVGVGVGGLTGWVGSPA